MNKEEAICELKRYLSKIKITYTKLDRHDQAIETVLKELENSISKDKIREKIKEKEREIQEFIGTDNTGRFIRDNCRITDEVNILQELLEEK